MIPFGISLEIESAGNRNLNTYHHLPGSIKIQFVSSNPNNPYFAAIPRTIPLTVEPPTFSILIKTKLKSLSLRHDIGDVVWTNPVGLPEIEKLHRCK